MKAAVIKSAGVLYVEDVIKPVPGEYQVLCKILYCATCNNTDAQLIKNRMFWQPPLPSILGHESIGEVVSIGRKVRNIKVGDVLTRIAAVYPGEKLGDYTSALGGFAEFGLATDAKAMLDDGIERSKINGYAFLHQNIPSNIEPSDATMVISLREELSWVDALGINSDSGVLILGDGAVGLGFVKCASLRGAKLIILVGHHDERLAEGKKLGADFLINSANGDFLPSLRKTAGKVDFLVDSTGNHKFVSDILDVLKKDGKIALYGVPKNTTGDAEIKDSRIQNISTDESGSHDEIIDFIRQGKLNPKNFYSSVMPLSRINEVFELIAEKKVISKVVVDCNG